VRQPAITSQITLRITVTQIMAMTTTRTMRTVTTNMRKATAHARVDR